MENVSKEKTWIFAGIDLLAILVFIALILSSCSSTKPLVIKPGKTEIKDKAYDFKYYTSVEIPEGITRIGKKAFADNWFTSVVIPYGVTTIDDEAFFSNDPLRSVIIPETVTRIGREAFGWCPNLQMVYIPESVTDLAPSAFNTHDREKQVTLIMGKDLPGEYIGDYKTLIKNNTAIITRYRGREKDVVIPAEINGVPVTGIGDYAFMQKQLTSVVIPDTVSSIGIYAFRWNYLNGVTIPEGVSSIGDCAFVGNQITDLVIPSGVKTIGENAFDGNRISSLVVPDSVTAIGDEAFANNQLTSVIIPNSVTYFSGFNKNKLTDIKIPDSVTTIGSYALAGNQLTSVVIPKSVRQIRKNAFFGNQLTNIVIPEGVEEIGSKAFINNKLASVVLPGSISKIDDPFDEKVAITGGGVTTLSVVSANLTLSGSGTKTSFIPSSGKTTVPVSMTLIAYNQGELSLSVNLNYAFKPGHTYALSKSDRAYAFPGFKILLVLEDKTDNTSYHWNYETSVPAADHYSGTAGRDAGRVSIQLKDEGPGKGSLGW
jgi:hypothetical protein